MRSSILLRPVSCALPALALVLAGCLQVPARVTHVVGRLTGIDPPGVDGGAECYGAEASAYVKSLLAGRGVMLEKDVSNTDMYGRLLRYLWADLDPNRPGLELVN